MNGRRAGDARLTIFGDARCARGCGQPARRLISPWAIVALALLVASAGQAGAQAAAYAPLAAQLPTSTRAQGAGGAWTTGRDASAVFSNPAYAGSSTSITLGASRFGRASTFGYAATSTQFGPRGIAFGVAWLDYGAQARAGIPWESLGSRGPDDGLSAMAVAAASLTVKGVRVGAAGKLMEERVANAHDGTPAFDLGAGKDIGPLTAGLSIQNIGATLDVRGRATFLPTRYTFGASTQTFPIGPFDLAGALALSVRRDGFFAPAGGVEFTYVPLEGYSVSVRAGAHRSEALTVNPFTLGASVAMDRFSLDYAFEDLASPGRGSIHSIGIRVR